MAVSPDADPKPKAKKLYWDEAIGGPLLLEASKTGVWDPQLVTMYLRIIKGLLGSSKYWRYDECLKDDLRSAACLAALKYAHSYDPAKANSSTPAFSWLTMAARSAIHWELKTHHYKHVNLEVIIRDCLELIDPDLLGVEDD